MLWLSIRYNSNELALRVSQENMLNLLYMNKNPWQLQNSRINLYTSKNYKFAEQVQLNAGENIFGDIIDVIAGLSKFYFIIVS